MNAFEYFVQVNGYLMLFYAFFYLLLKNETFFHLNRVYLIGGALLSFLIPLLHSDWINDLIGLRPVVETKMFINAWLIPVMVAEDSGPSWTISDWVVVAYLAVTLTLFVRFIFRLAYLLIKPVYEKSVAYSFFNRIFIADSLKSYTAIHKHEETHARQYHSVDVILLELISIVIWYNPVVYLYRRSVKHIHEFIADEVACIQERKEDYAMLLLSNTLGVPVSQLANNFFNESLLKKRIMMLYKKKSTRSALLKYGLSAPLFVGMLVFSSAKIDAGSKEIVEVADMAEPITTLQKIEEKGKEVVERAGAKKLSDAFTGIEEMPENRKVGEIADTVKEQKDIQRKGEVLTDGRSIEQMPDFPGGMSAFYKYIASTFKMPEAARKNKVSGRVIASFVVETDGTLTDIKILRDLGSGIGEEAIRVMQESPKWVPGKQNGKLVRVQFTLPIAINTANAGVKSVQVADTTYYVGKAPKRPFVERLPGGGPTPLYELDGKEATYSDVEGLFSEDVESIAVFKGASATAIYGDKGKNGVVKITTKAISGKNAQPARTFKGLVVINGRIQNELYDLNTLDPAKVKSINVLRGPDAIAQYGVSGKDGVLLIELR